MSRSAHHKHHGKGQSWQWAALCLVALSIVLELIYWRRPGLVLSIDSLAMLLITYCLKSSRHRTRVEKNVLDGATISLALLTLALELI